MVAIFPILDSKFCIATKWTRNFGFLITYSALLMKTWRLLIMRNFNHSIEIMNISFARVTLTFRVKSAHKLKVTDKQLLQWLFPILLVMLIYLGAWTFSDPPRVRKLNTCWGENCLTQWTQTNKRRSMIFFRPLWSKIVRAWSLSNASLGGGTLLWQLVIDSGLAKELIFQSLHFSGEFLFLMWGIKVCFGVRKARTHFDEARHIRWSIYNIAIVNIIMVSIQWVGLVYMWRKKGLLKDEISQFPVFSSSLR